MKYKICITALLVYSLVTACSQSEKSNQGFSDTTQVYDKENPDSVQATQSLSTSDTTIVTGTGSNNQSSRVSVGKDTTGKKN
ncbi:hypothetical protein [Desertivirga xinjiangensis]|uniref:hypothetical protein n=1 Tax=Desertivirga xinjiangensis TaxID=539206 RepID=UPI00210EAC88|nr:hypothetical protein [Pedobacter xinjiangensis]